MSGMSPPHCHGDTLGDVCIASQLPRVLQNLSMVTSTHARVMRDKTSGKQQAIHRKDQQQATQHQRSNTRQLSEHYTATCCRCECKDASAVLAELRIFATCTGALVSQRGPGALSSGSAPPSLERPLWIVSNGLPLQHSQGVVDT